MDNERDDDTVLDWLNSPSEGAVAQSCEWLTHEAERTLRFVAAHPAVLPALGEDGPRLSPAARRLVSGAMPDAEARRLGYVAGES